jgi:hypothetical protein
MRLRLAPTSCLALFALLSMLSMAASIGCTGVETASADDADRAGSSGPVADDRLVVVELFTSEGCSSCPPADKVLQELADDDRLASRVLPLSFHVDYWNYIGWTDPYSSKTWSKRQEGYARELSGRLYTPQMVVDGTTETVGSRRGEVREMIDEALRRPVPGTVSVEAGPAGDGLRVRVAADLAASADRGAELVLVVYENDLASSVDRGENAGRKLTHDGVVRHLERLGAVEPGASAERETTITVGKGWKSANVGVAAFLQDPETLRIVGAARAKPAKSAKKTT